MIDKLEKKFGKYAIKMLMKYVIFLYATGFIINLINPELYYNWLMLDIDKLLSGQVWRLVTFIIQPVDTDNIFRVFLSMYVYFMFGIALEGMWGSFRFNLYYFSGIFFNILAVIAIYIFTYNVIGYGYSYPIDLTYLNLTLFLAFAATFPETRFGIMGGNGGISMFTIVYMLAVAVDVAQAFNIDFQTGVLTLAANLVWLVIFCLGPKAKFMLVAYLVLIAVNIIQAFSSGWIVGTIISIAIGFSLLNFFIFFISLRKKNFAPMNPLRKQFKDSIRNAERRTDAGTEGGAPRHGKIVSIYRPAANTPRHRCAICGRTEIDDDNLEFRFCSKCNGSYEYCSDHLYTHEHKT